MVEVQCPSPGRLVRVTGWPGRLLDPEDQPAAAVTGFTGKFKLAVRTPARGSSEPAGNLSLNFGRFKLFKLKARAMILP